LPLGAIIAGCTIHDTPRAKAGLRSLGVKAQAFFKIFSGRLRVARWHVASRRVGWGGVGARSAEAAAGEVPLTGVEGGLAGFFEKLGDGDFIGAQEIPRGGGSQSGMPRRLGLRPVMSPAREGEQTGEAE